MKNILKCIKSTYYNTKTEYVKFMEKYGLYFWMNNK